MTGPLVYVSPGGQAYGAGGALALPAPGGGGKTQIFNFSSFAASDSSINTASTQPKSTVLPGSVLAIINGTGTHQSTGAWYNVGQVNVQSFTTTFQFQMTALQQPSQFTGAISGTTLTVSGFAGSALQVGTILGGNSNITAGTKITAFGTGSGGNGTYTVNISQTVGSEAMSGGANGGFTFVVQNSTSTTQSGGFTGSGSSFQGDANLSGYGGLAHLGLPQAPCLNSVALFFEWYTSQGQDAVYSTSPCFIGFNVNGGPDSNMIPHLDLKPTGLSYHAGNVITCKIVYDGTTLTVILLDNSTSAQFRYSWPINIPSCCQQNTAWVGFGGGSLVPVPVNILNWAWYAGYDTILSTPSASVNSGQYPTAQTVSLSGPGGATLYYTTNGLQPVVGGNGTSVYSGPITISTDTLLQWLASESTFTDSPVGSANYQIRASATPTINFPSGFAAASNLIMPVGCGQFSGTKVQLTDSLGTGGEAGGMWYVAPVSISSFSNVVVTIQAASSAPYGFAIVFQNQNTSASTGYVPAAPGSAPNGYGSGQLQVTGGPLALAQVTTGFGYGANQSPNTNGDGNGFVGLYSSVALVLSVSGQTAAVYTGGVFPSGASNQVNVTGLTLGSNHAITVALTYNSGTQQLGMTLTDTSTLGTFSHTFTSIDIPTNVGGSTAYFGVTAGNFNNGVQTVNALVGF